MIQTRIQFSSSWLQRQSQPQAGHTLYITIRIVANSPKKWETLYRLLGDNEKWPVLSWLGKQINYY